MKKAIISARRLLMVVAAMLMTTTWATAQQNSIPCTADEFNFSLYDAIDGKIEGGYNGLGSFKNGYTVTYTLNNTEQQAYTIKFAYKGGSNPTTIDFTFTDQDYNEVKASKTVQVVSDWAYTEVDIPELAQGDVTMVMKFTVSGAWACNMKEMSFQAQSAEKYVELPTVAFDLLRYTENQTTQAEDQRTSTKLEAFKNGSYVTYLLNNTIENNYLLAFEASTDRDDASIDVIITNKETGEELCSQNVVVKNSGSWNEWNLYMVKLPTLAVDKYVLKLKFNSSGSNWTANLQNLQFKDAAALTNMEDGNITLGSPWTTKGQIKCATIIDSTRDGAQAQYLMYNSTPGATYNMVVEAATPNAGVSIDLTVITLDGQVLATQTYECETCTDWKDYKQLKLSVPAVPEGFCLLVIDIHKADGQWCTNIGSITMTLEGAAVYVDLPAATFDLTKYTENQTSQAEDQRTATKLESFKNGTYVTYLLNNQEEKDYLLYFEGSTTRDDASVNVTVTDLATEQTLCSEDVTMANTGDWNTWQGYVNTLPTMAVGQYELKLTFKSSDTNWTANLQNLRFADAAVVNEAADGNSIAKGSPWSTSGTIKCADNVIDSDRNGAQAVYLISNAKAGAEFNLVVKAATPNEGVQLKVSALSLSGETLATNTLDIVQGSDWNTTQDYTYELGALPEGYSFVVLDIIKNDNSWAVNIHEIAFADVTPEPVYEAATIAELKALSAEINDYFTVMTYTGEALVNAVNGGYVYVSDATGNAIISYSGETPDLLPGQYVKFTCTGSTNAAEKWANLNRGEFEKLDKFELPERSVMTTATEDDYGKLVLMKNMTVTASAHEVQEFFGMVIGEYTTYTLTDSEGNVYEGTITDTEATYYSDGLPYTDGTLVDIVGVVHPYQSGMAMPKVTIVPFDVRPSVPTVTLPVGTWAGVGHNIMYDYDGETWEVEVTQDEQDPYRYHFSYLIPSYQKIQPACYADLSADGKTLTFPTGWSAPQGNFFANLGTTTSNALDVQPKGTPLVADVDLENMTFKLRDAVGLVSFVDYVAMLGSEEMCDMMGLPYTTYGFAAGEEAGVVFTYVYPLPVVDDLEVTVANYIATLNWTAVEPNPGQEILGYRIYLDGEVAGETDECTFQVENLRDGEHTFYVTVLVNEQESEASNEVVVEVADGTTTAIDTMKADGSEAVYTTLSGMRTEPTKPGLYIKTVGGKSVKVYVK